jgi:hypothetical protein
MKKQTSSSHQNVTCSRHGMAENCSHDIKQQSITHLSICVLSFEKISNYQIGSTEITLNM